jgi:hypothetical protein
MNHLQALLQRSINKPLKVDVRSVCENNIAGPITRTFLVPRKELLNLLKKTDASMDRIDVTEYTDESRCTMYNFSRIENSTVMQIAEVAETVVEWELDPQYGEWSARSSAFSSLKEN